MYKSILPFSYDFHSFFCIRKLVFKDWHCVLREDGTLVLEYVGNVHLMCVLIKAVYLVGMLIT
jgi:hypothetical protein